MRQKRAFSESLSVVTGKHEAGDIAIELGHPAALAVFHSDATVLILNPGVRGELLTNQVTAAVVCVANNQLRRAAFQRPAAVLPQRSALRGDVVLGVAVVLLGS